MTLLLGWTKSAGIIHVTHPTEEKSEPEVLKNGMGKTVSQGVLEFETAKIFEARAEAVEGRAGGLVVLDEIVSDARPV